MKKTLEEAIGQLRELPEDEQDAAADAVFAYVSSDDRQYHLLPHQIKEVRRIQKGIRDGTGRLASDEEVEAFKEKVGL
jgi:hypothetical protein